MKAGNGTRFEQSYNAQAAAGTETMLVVGKYVTNHANDKRDLRLWWRVLIRKPIWQGR
jgi:hypothetical protein